MAINKEKKNPLIELWLPLAVIRRSKRMQGITRLQKFVFLVEVEGHIGDIMGFTAYKYGPFSKRLHNMVRILENSGYLACEEEEMPEGYSERRDYCLTDEGHEFLEQLEQQWDFIKPMQAKLDVLSEYDELPTSVLRDYIYNKYLPDESTQPDIFNERLRVVMTELKSYQEVWENFEMEHYPLSYYVLAILEHSSEILDKTKMGESNLDNNIIVNSIRYLLRHVWNLLGALEESSEIDKNGDPDVVYFRNELTDIFEYVDEKAAKLKNTKSFQDLTLDDLTPKT